MRPLLLTALLFCAATCAAQPSRVIEALPDDSFIVLIGDRQYRAINADKAREIQKLRIDFDSATKVNAELAIQVKELTLQRDLAHAQRDLIQQKADSLKADFERAQGDATRWQGLFMSERELRVEASSFIPRGKASGFWGKALDFLNSQPAQIGFKLVIPTAQAIKVFAGRCQ